MTPFCKAAGLSELQVGFPVQETEKAVEREGQHEGEKKCAERVARKQGVERHVPCRNGVKQPVQPDGDESRRRVAEPGKEVAHEEILVEPCAQQGKCGVEQRGQQGAAPVDAREQRAEDHAENPGVARALVVGKQGDHGDQQVRRDGRPLRCGEKGGAKQQKQDADRGVDHGFDQIGFWQMHFTRHVVRSFRWNLCMQREWL